MPILADEGSELLLQVLRRMIDGSVRIATPPIIRHQTLNQYSKWILSNKTWLRLHMPPLLIARLRLLIGGDMMLKRLSKYGEQRCIRSAFSLYFDDEALSNE